MKVMHIESGLGNQMLDYVDYLAACYAYGADDIYIETIIYDIKEAHKTISMWNGYELEKIFGIKTANVRTLFTEQEWEQVLQNVKNSEFWKHNWNYSAAICDALTQKGWQLKDVSLKSGIYANGRQADRKRKIKALLTKNYPANYMKRKYLFLKYGMMKFPFVGQDLFHLYDGNVYGGHTLKFMYKDSGIETLTQEIQKCFQFPEIEEAEMINFEMKRKIQSCESVSIHVRRGDFLNQNEEIYKFGYFNRAVRYIKNRVKSPTFFIFCDLDSQEWCRTHLKILGLNTDDQIYYMQGNSADNSFRDMQLMSLCKHNIITRSSFGWWGSFLNRNPNKITCSPDIRIYTTNHF